MTQETLELATQLSELKKRYELKLDLLSYNDSQVAIAYIPSYKKKDYLNREEYSIIYNDKELIEIVKNYLRKKINDIQKQIDEI